MWFAKTQIEAVESEPDRTPLEKYEQSCRELAAIQTAMKAAEKVLVSCYSVRKDPRIRFVGREMFARLGAMQTVFPEIRQCQKRWRNLFEQHQKEMAESAQLKRECASRARIHTGIASG